MVGMQSMWAKHLPLAIAGGEFSEGARVRARWPVGHGSQRSMPRGHANAL